MSKKIQDVMVKASDGMWPVAFSIKDGREEGS